MAGETGIRVAVVYALPAEQVVEQLRMAPGSTVSEAIEQSGLLRRFPQTEGCTYDVGVYGKAVVRDTRLADGDRVEIYRPLTVDPKDARRRRATLRASRKKSAKA